MLVGLMFYFWVEWFNWQVYPSSISYLSVLNSIMPLILVMPVSLSCFRCSITISRLGSIRMRILPSETPPPPNTVPHCTKQNPYIPSSIKFDCFPFTRTSSITQVVFIQYNVEAWSQQSTYSKSISVLQNWPKCNRYCRLTHLIKYAVIAIWYWHTTLWCPWTWRWEVYFPSCRTRP